MRPWRQFYEVVLSGDLTAFALSEQDARGFFALLDAVASQGSPCPALKGQLSGPVTFAGVVKDAEGKPILYDRELTQAVCAGLARKAAWQAEKFRELGKEPIVFLDEPFLTGFGSAYLPISQRRGDGNPEANPGRGPGSRGRPGHPGDALLRQHRLVPAAHCAPSTSSVSIPTATLRVSASMTSRWRIFWPGAAGWPGAWFPPTRTLSTRTADTLWQRFKAAGKPTGRGPEPGAQRNPGPVPPYACLRDGLHEPGGCPPGVDHS